MNIEQLLYIVEVAKVKSLAKAAKTLNITQSGLSQAITKLESELNIKIFERTNTGANTTKEGDEIIEKACNVLLSIYQIKEVAHNQSRSSDYLKLSAIPGLIITMVDKYLQFKNNHSNLNIEIIEKGSFDIIKDIKNGDINIGFIAINHAHLDLIKELDFTPIVEGELKIYASKDFPLIDTKEQVTLDFLKDQLFVLYKDDYVEEYITTLQRLLGPINILFKTANLELIIKAVTEHEALTIGHDISSIFDQSQKMKVLNLVNFMDTKFIFGWVKKSDFKLSKAGKLYIEEINNTLLNTKKK